MASVENLCEVIGSLTVEVWTSAEPLPFDLRYNGTYRKLEIGESWGGLFDCGWFCFSGEIPEWANPAELALRIDVNSEFEVLYAFLEKLPEVLAPNGRVAILTFHSGEDRLVKRSFKQLYEAENVLFLKDIK